MTVQRPGSNEEIAGFEAAAAAAPEIEPLGTTTATTSNR